MEIIEKGKMHYALYKYKIKSGEFWGYRFKYYDDSNARREKRGSKFLSERDAFEDLVQVQSDINKGLISNANDFTVAQWYRKHIDMNKPDENGLNGNWSENTYINRLSTFNEYIKPLIGDIKIKKLTLSLYQSLYIDELKKTLAPSTVELYHRFVKISLNAAVKYKVIPENISQDVTLPKKRETDGDKFIDVDELKIVLNDFKENENITNYTIAKFIAYTGIRIGELRALKWKNVDFDKSKIQIYAQMTKHKYGPTKGNNKRILPVDCEVMNLLMDYRMWCVKRKSGILNQDDFIFISPQKGTVVGANTVMYAFERSEKRTGLSVTAHTLRHTHSAVLIMQNRSLKAISKRLGNSEEVLKSHYGHVIDSVDIDTMNAFSDALQDNPGADAGADLKNITEYR